MLYSICQRLFYKIRQEAVLSVAILLALLSACFVLPDASYFGYIDFRTLAILFSLMTVMAGLQRCLLPMRMSQKENAGRKQDSGQQRIREHEPQKSGKGQLAFAIQI